MGNLHPNDLHILPITNDEAEFLYKFLGGLGHSPYTALFMRLSNLIDPHDDKIHLSPKAVMEFMEEKFYIGEHGLCYNRSGD